VARYVLLDDDGKPTAGSVGYIDAVTGQPAELTLTEDGLSEDEALDVFTASPHVQQLIATEGHPLKLAADKKARK